MPRLRNDDSGDAVYRAKVTGRHAITLPSEVCEALEISTGDHIEIRLNGRQASLAPVTAVPSARGLLKGYFGSWEEINQFIQEERAGWEEHETMLDHLRDGAERAQSDSSDDSMERQG